MLTGATGQVGTSNVVMVQLQNLNSSVSLVLYNSSGVALKTLYGAGVNNGYI